MSNIILRLKMFIYIVGIAFILNFVWENMQAPLYMGYIDFWQHLPICFIATLGDVAIILFIFGCFALVYRNFYWLNNMNAIKIMILAILGAIISVVIEIFALNTGRWAYADAMPTINSIGVLPILQMVIILPLTFYLTSKFISDKIKLSR